MTREPAKAPQEPRSFEALVTEGANPGSAEIDRMNALEIAHIMNAEDRTVADAVAAVLPSIGQALEAIAQRLRSGGRLIYVGAGTSGRLGILDAVECPPTFNLPPGRIVGCLAGGTFAWDEAAEDQEDNAAAGEADLARLRVTAADAVVGITASGRTPYVLGAITHARANGALTIGLACNPASPLAERSDLAITLVVGPEVLAGSTRLKAGTAQKMVLNMLSTGAMILLGKTYGNLMVDVQATNAKLRARALRIVCQTTYADEERAASLLDAAGGEAKTAIAMARLGIPAESARARLAAHDGALRAALEEER
jgi:N-acetylmuramic acid 6-phosphate etherase